MLLATVLVVLVFGWTGGKQLVGSSYDDAKERTADMKAQRKEKKEEKREVKRQEKLRRREHRHDEDEAAEPDPSP